ncbi:uncharacterized protein LOC108666455 [Hyalella azteca]|uniref:Uncharacterized protein LOC108666455 n=1 Tax=Hyalella azteca TaxID=294128 RepID=A0A8B7N4N6_HYAAZ|nr:uncharacterized protein LOC108666455 [Hyalella azteca]
MTLLMTIVGVAAIASTCAATSPLFKPPVLTLIAGDMLPQSSDFQQETTKNHTIEARQISNTPETLQRKPAMVPEIWKTLFHQDIWETLSANEIWRMVRSDPSWKSVSSDVIWMALKNDPEWRDLSLDEIVSFVTQDLSLNQSDLNSLRRLLKNFSDRVGARQEKYPESEDLPSPNLESRNAFLPSNKSPEYVRNKLGSNRPQSRILPPGRQEDHENSQSIYFGSSEEDDTIFTGSDDLRSSQARNPGPTKMTYEHPLEDDYLTHPKLPPASPDVSSDTRKNFMNYADTAPMTPNTFGSSNVRTHNLYIDVVPHKNQDYTQPEEDSQEDHHPEVARRPPPSSAFDPTISRQSGTNRNFEEPNGQLYNPYPNIKPPSAAFDHESSDGHLPNQYYSQNPVAPASSAGLHQDFSQDSPRKPAQLWYDHRSDYDHSPQKDEYPVDDFTKYPRRGSQGRGAEIAASRQLRNHPEHRTEDDFHQGNDHDTDQSELRFAISMNPDENKSRFAVETKPKVANPHVQQFQDFHDFDSEPQEEPTARGDPVKLGQTLQPAEHSY